MVGWMRWEGGYVIERDRAGRRIVLIDIIYTIYSWILWGLI